MPSVQPPQHSSGRIASSNHSVTCSGAALVITQSDHECLVIMEVGVFVMNSGQRRQVDNRGASRSVSLCQIGLRWLSERRNLGFLPPLFSGCFKPLEAA